MAESKELRLAKKIVTMLRKEDYHDAVGALKIAKLLLPTPAAKKRVEKKEEAETDPTKGDLIPADEELMKFSKVMGVVASPAVNDEDESGLQ